MQNGGGREGCLPSSSVFVDRYAKTAGFINGTVYQHKHSTGAVLGH